ncbi:MAG TPA: hypothetical protein PK718_07140 [Candidatus Methanofastidiosa archaeon]|nr:hypothetical protein [Candidatus Methanofastidiosa archaeon]
MNKKIILIISLTMMLLLVCWNPVSSQPTNVAIFKDNDPWDDPTNEDVLTSLSIAYDVYTSADIGVVDLSAYDKVIIASDQTTAFYTAVEANRAYFENYVASGGVLQIHAADAGWYGGHWPTGSLPCGFQYSQYYGDYVDVIIPNHPLLNTPNVITDDELDDWYYSYHGGIISGFPDGAEIVLHDSFANNPVLVIANYGNGSVIVTSMTIEWATQHDYTYLLENTIVYDAGTYGPGNAYIANRGASPMALYMPLVRTNLAKANMYWECILENLPEEVPESVSALVNEVGGYMQEAITLTNPIATNAKLINAINLMVQINGEMELECVNTSA